MAIGREKEGTRTNGANVKKGLHHEALHWPFTWSEAMAPGPQKYPA